MSLSLYNTLTNKKEVFKSIEPNMVGMYVCGITVYDHCHLGHARAYVAFDVLARYLKYLGYKLNYVRNITDVEDKIIKKAIENSETISSITNRYILSMNKDFKDLGLLIIDEEQKFGVNVKDKMKLKKENVDILSMTATPIPRTLQFSLMGARDLSILNTPPKNRRPIITNKISFDKELIEDAINFEVERGGQVFFVHNNVSSIESLSLIHISEPTRQP